MSKLNKLTKKEQAIFNRVTIKKFKEGFGHDLMGYYCDVYLDNKKVGYVNDDGWGGDVSIDFTDDAKQAIFEKYLEENKIVDIMVKKLGWGSLLKKNEINYWSQGIAVVEVAIDTKQVEKFIKKINKTCISSIVYGTDHRYQSSGWKRLTLAQIVKHPALGIKPLQALYDKIKGELKDGERIFNTNLRELGVKL